MPISLSLLDKCCLHVDTALRAIVGSHQQPSRENPANKLSDDKLTEIQRKHTAGLMRVNHVGEVCAQALYQGQAITAREKQTADSMADAAQEEVDHLVWCQQSLKQLNSHVSYLNPLWYVGSLSLGITAGLLGDKWSLGFVAETENQVVAHLDSHLGELPENAQQVRAVVTQMRDDEAAHAQKAVQCGATELPAPVKTMMRGMAKVMTRTAYYV